MKQLKDILFGVSVEKIVGTTAIEIAQVAFDSRKVVDQTLFVAQKGLQFDGHAFIDQAIKEGANAVICQTLPTSLNKAITYVQVEDSNKALAILASNFFGNPSQKLKLIGVTGTNGKTTIATLLYQLFKNLGKTTGLLSTIKIMIGDKELPATHTTPDSIMINSVLNDLVEQGGEYCFMEVSSHGIHQKRTAGLHFTGGIFTNLTHDHLDYHETFAAYRDVKKVFFDQLPKSAFALTNIDDKNGAYMLQNTSAKKYTYAVKTLADYKVRILENSFNGLHLQINQQEVYTKLIGAFNAYNLLAIFGVADLLQIDQLESLKVISSLETVAGRFQYFTSKSGIHVIVDYAHTPDALKNVLETINTVRTFNEQVITIVGCGGDRDKTKRPKMGQIAAALSNQVVITSDNPRTEDPEQIIRDVEAGVSPEHFNRTLSITDRKQAIKTACKLAASKDIVLIAGKGHETYQIIGTVKSDFDDFKIAQETLIQLNK